MWTSTRVFRKGRECTGICLSCSRTSHAVQFLDATFLRPSIRCGLHVLLEVCPQHCLAPHPCFAHPPPCAITTILYIIVGLGVRNDMPQPPVPTASCSDQFRFCSLHFSSMLPTSICHQSHMHIWTGTGGIVFALVACFNPELTTCLCVCLVC